VNLVPRRRGGPGWACEWSDSEASQVSVSEVVAEHHDEVRAAWGSLTQAAKGAKPRRNSLRFIGFGDRSYRRTTL